MLQRQTYLDSLSRDAADFISLIRTSDLDAAVPACAGWDLGALARHVGVIHRWAYDSMVLGRSAEAQVTPEDDAELVSWLEVGAARLIDHLTTSDPQTATWTFGPSPRTLEFWVRRQPHEIAVHLFDARRAVGQEHAIEAEFAADGVDEVVSMFFPRQVRHAWAEPLTEGVRLVAADVGEQWVLAGDGTDQSAPFVATVTGAAAQLYQLVWRRIPWSGLAVDGDRGAVERAFGTALTP